MSATFLSAANAAWLGELYRSYRQNPENVDAGWQDVFAVLGDAVVGAAAGNPVKPAQVAANIPANDDPFTPSFAEKAPLKDGAKDKKPAPVTGAVADADAVRNAALDSVRLLMIIRAYRVRGHLYANLDPLKLTATPPYSELDPAHYGFAESDWDRPILLAGVLGRETATLREVMAILRATYCGSIGFEFMHIQDSGQKDWLQTRIEAGLPALSPDAKKAVLQALTQAESFEKFLHTKYVGTKRFGLDGGESMIPALEAVLATASRAGVEEVTFGMAHRGRLNVLTNILHKPFLAVFSEFQGKPAHPDDVQGSGDVKYHLGTSQDREFDGKKMHVSLNANPSHLEAVNPVVLGKVRAKQHQRADETRQKVLPILIHGDAAFAGQGVVGETLMMSDLKGYRVGGTLHFVINNQIGFTTSPVNARSGPYCTDVALAVQAPIFHVNGDDPEAVVQVAKLATEYRQQFGRDVVIDMFCYRRYGHNESDEPAFTQPLMYQAIAGLPNVRVLYAERLVAAGTIDATEAQALVDGFMARLQQDFAAATEYVPDKADWLEGRWRGLGAATPDDRRGKTAVSLDDLKAIGAVMCHVPEGFNLNAKIARQLEAKQEAINTGKGIDWATAEALAFGSLLKEGFGVRLSGQDCGRGTFSQRHAVVYDQKTEARHVFLNHVAENQQPFEVLDSPLSEFAVMGFDYGYSLAEPNSLVCWEGQFGDFVNGAQVMIDQFIASAEAKWLRMSGLTLLLPHGFEGAGPEHSSARLERFLQLCAEDNIQVANCSTPANYFHILRRQLHRPFRKPLVIMTPKYLLRHKACVSDLAMFSGDESFHRVLYEDVPLCPPEKARRVVLCSGKVWYDLVEEREKRGITDIVTLRLEQFYPFPDTVLAELIKPYVNADIVWCQEEPENQGAWNFVDRRLEKVLKSIGHKTTEVMYAGRVASAAPATGLLKRHNAEQAALLDVALTITS